MTAYRLSTGGLVDRSKSVGFRFDGVAYKGFEGDTLASALMARQRVRMATVAGVPVGYVGFGVDAARGPMVFHLYIAPGWWRRGIGTRLLTEAKAALGPRLSLFCIKRNTAARAFYERHGFRVAATSDGAGTEEGEPDILFARDDGSPDRDDKVGATDERNA